MSDPFQNNATGLSSPANTHYTITPSDSADLPLKPRAIFALTDGNAVLRDAGGVDVTYAVTAGTLLPFRPVRVMATGTTATLVAWY